MSFSNTPIAGLIVYTPRVHGDDRGYFMESYNQRLFESSGIDTQFVQDNEAVSSYGVMRGLHYQCGDSAQAKLVRVSRGEVLDVVVDIRPDSSTYGKHFSIRLSAKEKNQLFIPRGFAHGYAVLSDLAVFQYKCDNYYDPESEAGIKFDDPQLAIDWMIPEGRLQLSAKDKEWPVFGGHRLI